MEKIIERTTAKNYKKGLLMQPLFGQQTERHTHTQRERERERERGAIKLTNAFKPKT